MRTQVLPFLLFAGAAGALSTIILLKVGKLRGSPHLAFVEEQPIDFAQGGRYALWLTGGARGFSARPHADIRLIESATGADIEINSPRWAPLIRGFGTYRQVATFAIERAGRYTLRITDPAPPAARLVLERCRG